MLARLPPTNFPEFLFRSPSHHAREEVAWVQTLTSWMSAEAGKWTADEWLVWFEGLDEENQRKWKEVHSDYPHCFDFDVKDGSAELLQRSLGLFLPGSSSRAAEGEPPAVVTREAPLLEVAEAEAAAEAAAEQAARAAALAEEEAKKVLRQAFEEMAAGSKRKEQEDSGLSNIPAVFGGDMATPMTPPPSKAVRPPPMQLQGGPAFQSPWWLHTELAIGAGPTACASSSARTPFLQRDFEGTSSSWPTMAGTLSTITSQAAWRKKTDLSQSTALHVAS